MRDLPFAVREGGLVEGEPQGFAVYQNNHWVSLLNGMEAAFPAVFALVDEVNFKGLARQYLTQNPPQSKLMFELGGDFPAFLQNIDVGLPYLWEVAQIEVLWRESFHETDATPLTIADFQALDLSRLGEMRLTFHPSMRVFSSNMAAFSIYTDVLGLSNHEFDISTQEEGVIIRPNFEVEGFLMPQGSVAFINALHKITLGEAIELFPNFDFNQFLSLILTKNIITGVTL